MLHYSLHENLLTKRTDDYTAQTYSSSIYTREQLIDLMVQHGTLVTKTDIVAVFNNLEEVVGYIIENGGQLNLPLFNTRFSVSGVFNGATDTFDPARHQLHVTIHKGVVVREAEKAVRLSKINAPSRQPQVLEVKDSISGQVDTILTAGGVVEINGINLKITGTDPTTGLYFVAEDMTDTKAVTIVSNKPATLIAIIPTLPAGNYQVKIVTQYAGYKDLKEPRTTIFGKTLRVE